MNITWGLVMPQDGREWKAALMLVLGGMVGWLLSPLIWFAWGPMRWPAFLLASAAQESGYDPAATGAAGEVGILQWSADSAWLRVVAVPIDPANDWRLNPFWAGYYAARYYNAQAWSAPMLIAVWLIPVFGPAAARYTWTHALEDGGVERVTRNAWNVVWDPENGEKAFRAAYPIWWSVWHLPLMAVLLGWYFSRE